MVFAKISLHQKASAILCLLCLWTSGCSRCNNDRNWPTELLALAPDNGQPVIAVSRIKELQGLLDDASKTVAARGGDQAMAPLRRLAAPIIGFDPQAADLGELGLDPDSGAVVFVERAGATPLVAVRVAAARRLKAALKHLVTIDDRAPVDDTQTYQDVIIHSLRRPDQERPTVVFAILGDTALLGGGDSGRYIKDAIDRVALRIAPDGQIDKVDTRPIVSLASKWRSLRRSQPGDATGKVMPTGDVGNIPVMSIYTERAGGLLFWRLPDGINAALVDVFRGDVFLRGYVIGAQSGKLADQGLAILKKPKSEFVLRPDGLALRARAFAQRLANSKKKAAPRLRKFSESAAALLETVSPIEVAIRRQPTSLFFQAAWTKADMGLGTSEDARSTPADQ